MGWASWKRAGKHQLGPLSNTHLALAPNIQQSLAGPQAQTSEGEAVGDMVLARTGFLGPGPG